MRRLSLVATGFLVGLLVLLALPAVAFAGSSTTIVVSRFTIPSNAPAYGVDTDGRYVVYFGYNFDLFCYDLQTNKEIAIPGGSGYSMMASHAAIADGICIWIPEPVPEGIDGYDIATGQSFTLSAGTPQSPLMMPVIGDGIVAWTTGAGGDGPVDAYDVATDTQFSICPNPDAVREVTGVARGLVVWDQAAMVGDTADIWGYQLKTKQSFAICTNPAGQTDPVTDGQTVAWQDCRDGNYADVWAYDVATKHTYRMSGAARCVGSSLDVDQGMFVWGDLRGQAWSVRGYYVPSHTEFVISPNSGAALLAVPRIANNVVVWSEQLGNVITVVGARLHEWVCSASAPAKVRARTVKVTVSSKGSAGKVTRMRFSVNGGRWTAWTAFRHTHLLTLPGGAGSKKVHVELRDSSGRLSRVATATVRLL